MPIPPCPPRRPAAPAHRRDFSWTKSTCRDAFQRHFRTTAPQPAIMNRAAARGVAVDPSTRTHTAATTAPAQASAQARAQHPLTQIQQTKSSAGERRSPKRHFFRLQGSRMLLLSLQLQYKLVGHLHVPAEACRLVENRTHVGRRLQDGGRFGAGDVGAKRAVDAGK